MLNMQIFLESLILNNNFLTFEHSIAMNVFVRKILRKSHTEQASGYMQST